jgi:hypothetical protein
MPDSISDLLKLRNHREQKARNHVVHSKAQLDLAEADKKRKEQDCEAYQHWRLNEEERLFASIQERPIAVQDLLSFRGSVHSLRAGQRDRAHRVEEAAQQVAQAEAALMAARQSHIEACRKQVKIQTYRKRWLKMQQQEEERAAENEMDACGQTACFGKKVAP